MAQVKLIWEWGTAYDLFISLHVLHHPSKVGLRGAWAAGVRSRLPEAQRKTLEAAQEFLVAPVAWIQALPEPRDSETALRAIGELPPAERLPVLSFGPETPPRRVEVLQEVASRGEWTAADRAALRETFSGQKAAPPAAKALRQMLNGWARAVEFGERYLDALRAYREAFFAEEEDRIRPALQAALDRAQALARRTTLPELIEELSRGVRFAGEIAAPELALVPSFWIDPLVMFERVREDRALLVFGARPVDASLVPGEVVPDALFLPLKALADPTRLRIMRYLAHESLTPTRLARRLRLRAPTVVHHLTALRAAGLVHLTLEAKGERHYAARREALQRAFEALESFLAQGEGPERDPRISAE